MEVLRTTFLISNILLCVSFIVHLFVRFRKSPNRFFLIFWAAFWASFILYYILGISIDHISTSMQTGSFLREFINVLNAILLGIASEYFFIRAKVGRDLRWLRWVPLLLLIFPTFFFQGHELLIFKSFIASYLPFISMAIYAGRFFLIAGQKAELTVIVLYIYASINLIWSMIDEPNTYVVLYGIALALKFILYQSGYIYLTNLKPISEVNISKSKSITPIIQRKKKPIKTLPDPKVEVSLTGLWGFLYVMWKYPSGKLVVFVMLLTIVMALLYIMGNRKDVLELLNYIK